MEGRERATAGKADSVRNWIAAVLVAVIVSGAALLALPYPNYCNQCFQNNPAWLCYLAGCW